jgi:hypothetical protein
VTFDDVTIQGVNGFGLNLSAGPEFTANLAYLQVRSGDVASHIHMDTGNNNAYDLIVGNDDKFVQVSSTGNIIMSSYDGNTSYTWTLDTTGNLTTPSNLVIGPTGLGSGTGFTQLDAPLLLGSSEANGGMSLVWYENPTGPGNVVQVGLNSSNLGSMTVTTGDLANTSYVWDFDNEGNLTLPTGGALTTTGNISANNFTGNGGGLSNVATKVTGSWTLASGNNTVSISVPLSGTYTIWVNGNIPNGIITYTATAVVTNTNVPVLGEQYGWFYEAGNALVLTSIPNQFVGTAGVISNAVSYLGNTANVFTFGITNNSGNTAVVNYGYTKL